MRARVLWRLSAGAVVMACLGEVQIAQAQRRSPAAGPTQTTAGAEAVVPFKILIPDAGLLDLKQRLSRARFADDFPEAGWDYGTNLVYLKSLVDYWRDKYDWRAQEKRLNQ